MVIKTYPRHLVPGRFFGGKLKKKKKKEKEKTFRLLGPPKQLPFLTIYNENIF